MKKHIDKAKKIKLLLLDVDGVLTDGRIIYGASGEETKNYDVHDGLGVVLMRRAGIKCAILTAKGSPIVKKRARVLGIDRVYSDFHFKIEALPDIRKKLKVKDEEICFIGDDLVDLPVLKRVGLAVAVPNAIKEVKETAHFVTTRKGGRGAVREVCEMILKAQGKWSDVTRKYFV